jgi:Methylmalonyl-CoA mutase
VGSNDSRRFEGCRLRQETRLADGRRLCGKALYRRKDLPGTTGQARFNGKWEPRSLADIPKDAVRGDLLHEQGATSVQEVGYALAESAGKRNTFVFAVGGNYFMEIAKLRAARQLWARISKEPVVIWSRTSSFPHRAASMGASLP